MEKEEWLKRYKARLLERGLSEEEAEYLTKETSDDSTALGALAFDLLLEDDPEDAADDELSYWASDG